MDDYISREAAIAAVHEHFDEILVYDESGETAANEVEDILLGLTPFIPIISRSDVRAVPEGGIGEMSDGYHTFNGLYYQRMILFAALVKQNKERAWKSHRHEDGELCFGGGWFIVGIDTPEGSYTYHYEDKDWDLFECEELPAGKHWDGHTEDEVTRLLSLPEMRPVKEGHWINHISDLFPADSRIECDQCHAEQPIWIDDNFCPNCGADMRPAPEPTAEKPAPICKT